MLGVGLMNRYRYTHAQGGATLAKRFGRGLDWRAAEIQGGGPAASASPAPRVREPARPQKKKKKKKRPVEVVRARVSSRRRQEGAGPCAPSREGP